MAYPVAVVQPDIEPGIVEDNRQTVTRMVAEAANAGAKLIALPEACVSDLYRDAGKLAESIPGPTTEVIARVAANAVVAVPVLEKKGNAVHSSCALVNKDGVVAVARKTHLYRDATGHDAYKDDEVIIAGKELTVAELPDINVGVLLGFDAEFPEAFRALALRGADLIIVALNMVEPDRAFLASMALRNRVPIMIANRLGFKKVYPTVPEFSAMQQSLLQDKEGNFLARCRGSSAIIDEHGRAIAEPGAGQQRELDDMAGAPDRLRIPKTHFQEEAILTASFRIEELRVQRLTSPYFSERNESLYKVSKRERK